MMKKGQKRREKDVEGKKNAEGSGGRESEWAAAKTVFAILSVFSGHEG